MSARKRTGTTSALVAVLMAMLLAACGGATEQVVDATAADHDEQDDDEHGDGEHDDDEHDDGEHDDDEHDEHGDDEHDEHGDDEHDHGYGEHDHGDLVSDINGMGAMGGPNATPAADVEGADLVSVDFDLLESRPDGFDDTTGTADLARHDGGTTVTLKLDGLDPGREFVAHVHKGSCADNGGPHYKFDPDGSDSPPNEIHLLFTSDDEGSGFMTAENEQVVGDDAQSIVVHATDAMQAYIACAPLS